MESPCACRDYRERYQVNLETVVEVLTPGYCAFHHLNLAEFDPGNLLDGESFVTASLIKPICPVGPACQGTGMVQVAGDAGDAGGLRWPIKYNQRGRGDT